MNYTLRLALIFAVFFSVVACLDANAPEAISEPVASPTPTAEEILQEAFDNIDAVNSLHFQATGEVSLKQKGVSLDIPFTFEGDMVLPDKVRADFTFSLLGLTVKSRIIEINDKVYLRDPATNEWEVSEEPFFGEPVLYELNALDSLEEIEFVGDEEVEGVDFQRFKAILPPGSDEELAGYSKWEFWVRKSDTQLTKLSFSGELREGLFHSPTEDMGNPFGFAEGFEQGEGDLVSLVGATVSFSNFDENIVIFAPTVRATPR